MMRSSVSLAPWLLPLGLHVLGVLALPVLTPASVAKAQTTSTLTARLFKIGDSTYDATAKRPISKAQCDTEGLNLTFFIEGLPGNTANPKFVEAWLGGTKCNLSTRTDTTTGDPCVQIASAETSSAVQLPSFTIPANKLCDKDGNRDVWFLGVDEEEGSKETNLYVMLEVPVDTTAPTAPKNVRGGSGETEIPVKWSTADEDVDHYLVLWDPEASSAPSAPVDAGDDDDGGAAAAGPKGCSSAVLMSGDEYPDNLKLLPDGVKGKLIKGKVESTTLSGDTLGSDLAAVGVIAVDLAGNPSEVSNIACLKVVPTTGFWQQYRADGGDVEPGCACTLPGERGLSWSAWPVLLAFFALVMRSRRRQS